MSAITQVDAPRILELYTLGNTQQDIADIVGCSQGAVAYQLNKYRHFAELTGGVDDFRSRRADIFAGLQAKLVAGIANKLDDENQFNKLSAYAMTGMMALIYDKERLETGKSSSNVAILSSIITKSEESGDTALRKLSISAPKLKEVRQIDEADVVGDSGTRK
jgi:predicted transcriptional regulator